MTGVERRRRQRGHRLEVVFEALADALAVPARRIAKALFDYLTAVPVMR